MANRTTLQDMRAGGTTLTTQGAKRLLKLAAFLRTMPKAKFDFGTIMDVRGKPPLEALKAGEHPCGTVGCAVGWMPAVWPKQVKWAGNFTPWVKLVGHSYNFAGRSFDTAEKFFGLSYADVRYLFNPGNQDNPWNDDHGITDWSRPRNNHLPYNSSPKRIAAHIRKFVKANYAGKANLNYGTGR